MLGIFEPGIKHEHLGNRLNISIISSRIRGFGDGNIDNIAAQLNILFKCDIYIGFR